LTSSTRTTSLPTSLPAWKALASLAQETRERPLRGLVTETGRSAKFTREIAGCLFDFSKQRVDGQVLQALHALAEQCGVADKATAMFSGQAINTSEQRAVLHPALRGGAASAPAEIRSEVHRTQQRMFELAESIRDGTYRGYTNKPIKDVVHIGIGGSHLGPELVVDALRDYRTCQLRFHFVANIDANDLHDALAGLNPDTTLFVIVSKSFGTLETQINANSARSWFLERTGEVAAIRRHFIGVTSNIAAATEFGLDEAQLLPMWDWVGGRFSLWSAVGLPILLSLGTAGFQQFLDGAKVVDEHFIHSPIADNIPLLSALFATWNYNFLGAASLAVLPYDERLSLLADYLQQLEMESNGKSVDLNGETVTTHTMPILWGGTGTRGQHAYHQLLHQGSRAYCADFIVVRNDARQKPDHHRWLLANALAQSQAMAAGQPETSEPHKRVPGNHPTTTIVLDDLGPTQLGALLAVYEHKVFCHGVIWNINSFDQWGVELGKKLAKPIYTALSAEPGQQVPAQDDVTAHLIQYLNGT
jgi:glucose-6-phosphate isomerase